MAKYRIEELSFIDNVLVQAGEEIETNAAPGTHWTPLDKDATKGKKAAEAAAKVVIPAPVHSDEPTALSPLTEQEVATLPQE
jgi:hypothetical protein